MNGSGGLPRRTEERIARSTLASRGLRQNVVRKQKKGRKAWASY